MNLHSTLRVSVVTREQRECILPLPCHYGAPDSARWGLSGGGNVSLCLYPAVFENDGEMGETLMAQTHHRLNHLEMH